MANGTPVGNMIIKVDLDAVGVEKSMTGLQRQLKSANKAMGAQLSAFNRSEKSISKYNTLIDGLTNRHKIQAQMVEEAKKKYDEMSSTYGENSVKAQQAAQELNTQIARYQETGRELDAVKKEFAEFQRVQEVQSKTWYKVADGMENYGGKMKVVGRQMDSVGGKMTKGITVPALGAATAVGGMVAAFGWKRLTSLDTAQAQLKGFGYSAKEVEVISGDVRKAVQGTTMTMAEGTSVAAGALAAGVKQGKQLEKYIRRVGNAAVGANVPVEEMAQLFNRVEGAGKLMTDELNQIEYRMPGFSKAMAKHLGVPVEEMRKMVTAGEVTSKDFMKVMDDFAGGMAEEYAKTWDGMVANTKANIGIIGEAFLQGVFQDSKKSLADFIDLLKTPEIKQSAEEMGKVAQEAFTKMKDSIVGVVEWYINLDDGQKEIVNSLGLLAVAGGPALQMFGKLTTGLGHVFEATGKLGKAIGTAKGAGLVAGLARLGPAGVAGATVLGLGAVATGMYTLHKANNNTLDDILKHTQKRREEIDTLDDTIGAYQKLQGQNKLTSDEVLRYMDIMTELKNAKTEEGIKSLTKEQQALLKKSGMTNDEMDEFLRLNGEIISKTPEATQKISEQGNAYAGTAEKAKQLNDTERERLIGETYFNITGELHSQSKAFEKQAELQDRLKRQEDYRTELIEGLNVKHEQLQTAKGKEKKQLEEQIKLEQVWLNDQDKKIGKTQKSIEQNDKQLDQFNQLVAEHEALVLSEVNLTSEAGKGNEAIKTRQKEIDKAIKKLKEEHETGKLSTKEFNKQNKELREEQSNLDKANGKLNKMQSEIDRATGKHKQKGNQIDNNNKKTDAGIKKEQARTKEAGKSVKKNVNATDNNTIAKIDARAMAKKMKTVAVRGEGISKLNADASKPVTKKVNVVANMIGKMKSIARGYAKGTPPKGHPGGDFIAGERGTELGILPDGTTFLTPNTATFYPDMPKGTHVIPHKETEKMLKFLPKYATGTEGWTNALRGSELAKLLALNKTSDTTVSVENKSSKNNSDNYLNKLLQATLEQNKLLMQLLKKDTKVIIDPDGLYDDFDNRLTNDSDLEKYMRGAR